MQLVRSIMHGAATLVWTGTILAIAGAAFADTPSADRMKSGSAATQARSDQIKVLEKGSSTRASRLEAVKRLPLDRLDAGQRKRVDDVLESVSLFRELPTVAFEVEPDVYRYFLDRPEMAVSVWKALGISKFKLSPVGENRFEADMGDGTAGTVEVLRRTDEACLLLCDGSFKAPLALRAIRSQCVLLLETQFFRTQDGHMWAKHRALMFVAFPSQTVETTAKVISPISNVIVDHNFREISLFLRMMSLAMERQPGWVERLTQKMDGTSEAEKKDLLRLTAHVYVQSRKRELGQNGAAEETSVDEILAPLKESQEAKKAIAPASSETVPSSAHRALPAAAPRREANRN